MEINFALSLSLSLFLIPLATFLLRESDQLAKRVKAAAALWQNE
jgi:hypothetical protein